MITSTLKASLTQCLLFLVAFGLFALACTDKVLNARSTWFLPVLLVLAGLVCIAVAIRLSDEAEKLRALAHMAGRPRLSEAEFVEHYFPPDRAEIVSNLRRILAKHLPVDLSRMQPSDRFVDDLRMDALDSLSTVEFVIDVEKEFGIEIPDSDAEKMTTFQEVVNYVAAAVKAKIA